MKIVKLTKKCKECRKKHEYDVPELLLKNRSINDFLDTYTYCPNTTYSHTPYLFWLIKFDDNLDTIKPFFIDKLINDEPIFGYTYKTSWDKKRICDDLGINYEEMIKEQCKRLISNFKYRKDFEKAHPVQARFIFNRKLQDEMYKNMTPIGSLHKRLIYVWVFPDNHFYVGLTCNTKRRNDEHRTKMTSAVFQHIQKTGLQPEYKELTGYVDVEEASKLESAYEKQYIDAGYFKLNKKKCGGIGASNGYTFEQVNEKAQLCITREEFKTTYGGYYKSAKDNGWYEKITEHMVWLKKPNGYWTMERITNSMSKFDTISEFKHGERGAYDAILRMGKIDVMHNFFNTK